MDQNPVLSVTPPPPPPKKFNIRLIILLLIFFALLIQFMFTLCGEQTVVSTQIPKQPQKKVKKFRSTITPIVIKYDSTQQEMYEAVKNQLINAFK